VLLTVNIKLYVQWQVPPAGWWVFSDAVAGFLRADGWIEAVFTDVKIGGNRPSARRKPATSSAKSSHLVGVACHPGS